MCFLHLFLFQVESVGGSDLVQLVDALFHAADGGHSPQGVSVELPEAVLSADLEQRHHGSLLHENTRSDQCGKATTARSDVVHEQRCEAQSVAVPFLTVGRQYFVQN